MTNSFKTTLLILVAVLVYLPSVFFQNSNSSQAFASVANADTPLPDTVEGGGSGCESCGGGCD